MKKKLFVFIFAIAFILTAGICLTACGGGGDDRTLTNVTLSFAGDDEESTVVNKNIYEDQGWNSLNFRINLYYSDGSNYYDYYQRDELARYVDSVEYRASSTATAVGKDYATFNQLAEEYNLDVGIWKITLVYNDYVLIANINVLSKQDNNAYTLEINSLVNNSFSRKNTISYGTRYAGIEWKVYKNQVPTAIDSSLVSLRILTDDNGYKEIGDASTTEFGTPKQAAEQSKLSDLASNIGYLNAGNYLVCAEIRNEDYNVETTYSAFTKLTVLKSKIEFIGTPTFTYNFIHIAKN